MRKSAASSRETAKPSRVSTSAPGGGAGRCAQVDHRVARARRRACPHLGEAVDAPEGAQVDQVLAVLEVEDRVAPAAVREHEAVGTPRHAREVAEGRIGVTPRPVVPRAADEPVATVDGAVGHLVGVAVQRVRAGTPEELAAAAPRVFQPIVEDGEPGTGVAEQPVRTGTAGEPVVPAEGTGNVGGVADEAVVAQAPVEAVGAAGGGVGHRVGGIAEQPVVAQAAGEVVGAALGGLGHLPDVAEHPVTAHAVAEVLTVPEEQVARPPPKIRSSPPRASTIS